MRKVIRRMLFIAAAMVLMAGARILLCGGSAGETAYAAKADYSSCYKVSKQKITIKKGYKNKDITEILNAALVEARDKATAKKPITVVVPKGTYKLTGNLRIYSNTTLDLTGVTLKYTGKESHIMIQFGTNGAYKGVKNYNKSKKCAGYKGFSNITIKGGTLKSSDSNTSSIIRVAHAKNITLEDITFVGGGCAHQVEAAAIDGFYVKNCTFRDWNGAASSKDNAREKYEALQLDIPCATAVYRDVYLDGTIMKNVEVTGCTFKNVPRGVGSHSFLLGAYFDNIKINNNTFINVEEEAIVCVGYKNSEIKDNTITDCGAGILFQYFKANTNSVYTTIFDGKTKYKGKVEHNANSVISGNNITIKYSKEADEVQAIKVYGGSLTKAATGGDGKKIAAKDYYISGVTISDNTITTAGYSIHLMNARDCTITGNTITAKGVKASDKKTYDGIYLAEGSTAIDIKDNTISKMSSYGIEVGESCTVTGEISGNTITACSAGGLLVTDSGTANKINGNTFKKVTGNAAIAVYNKAAVEEISDNTIEVTGSGKKANTHGIKASSSVSVGSITCNKIKNATSEEKLGIGILIYDKAKVTGSIAGNSIESPKEWGISISTNATVGKDISDNTVSFSKKTGIFIYSGSTVKGNISGNEITNSGEDGIRINDNATVSGGINNNTITSAEKRGIYIDDTSGNSTVTEIKGNTIDTTKSYGINLNTTKNDVTIADNTIRGCADHAMIVQPEATKYMVTITGNTITGNGQSDKSAIHIVKGNVYVADNTLSNAGYGVHAAKGVTGTIDMNSYGDGIEHQIYSAGKAFDQTGAIKL